MNKTLVISVLALHLSFSSSQLKATPYASAVTNDAGTIRFILNEDAGNV